jgi:hypothetical protein
MHKYLYPLLLFATITGVVLVFGSSHVATGPAQKEYALLLAVDAPSRTLTARHVTWLTGDEAVAAAVIDHPECTTQNISDCAASLANGFYIDNTPGEEQSFGVKKGARIRILKGGSAEYQETSATLRELGARLEVGPRLVELSRRGDEVYRLTEVYLP